MLVTQAVNALGYFIIAPSKEYSAKFGAYITDSHYVYFAKVIYNYK
jgi:hypothetical protein